MTWKWVRLIYRPKVCCYGVMWKLCNRSESVCRATKRQWCLPISARSEHKQSWKTAREWAPPISDRQLPPADALRRHCTELQTAAASLQGGGGRSWVSGQQACWSATTVVTDQRVAKQRSDRYVAGDVSLINAGRHRRLAVFTLWRLEDRALLKLENGSGRDYPQSMLPVMGNMRHGLAA